jgi:hypothetical protein
MSKINDRLLKKEMVESADSTHKERGDALMWFLLIVAGVWVLWYFGGGPARANQEGEKPFMKPLQPIDSGEVYQTTGH